MALMMLTTKLSDYLPTFIRTALTLMHVGIYVYSLPLLLLSHLLPLRSDSPNLVRGTGADLPCGITLGEEFL